uniref:Ig-like domain-containing protein n=1 Tax=Mola mola TaxID=94237 RepID=A0A3Q3VXI2_MOLML
MEQKLQLCVFMLHIQASLALWQRMTVMKGQTVLISCPITNALQTNVEWKNPEGYILFFKHSLKSKRHRIHKLSESEFTVSISSVTFKDGGNYTCSEYSHPMTEKTVELTVLDQPKMKKTKHQGRFDIKCTAEGNHYPSQIFWKLNHGPEILAHPQVLREDKKYISSAILSIQSVENGVTVTCLVRHPNLHTRPLMDFVKVKENCKYNSVSHSLTYSSSNFTDHDTTFRRARFFSHTSAQQMIFEEHSHSTFRSFTCQITTQSCEKEGNSSLLIFLVTCLIFALLVVVIFFAIKMRRVHITWQRGLFNTVFTQYVVEETPATTSVRNTAAMAATDSVNREQNSQPQSSRQTEATSDRDKETSL